MASGICPVADSRIAQWRPAELPTGGQVFWEGMNRLIGGNGNPAVYSNSPRNLRKHAAYWRGTQLRRALHDRAATLNGENAPTPLGGPTRDRRRRPRMDLRRHPHPTRRLSLPSRAVDQPWRIAQSSQVDSLWTPSRIPESGCQRNRVSSRFPKPAVLLGERPRRTARTRSPVRGTRLTGIANVRSNPRRGQGSDLCVCDPAHTLLG